MKFSKISVSVLLFLFLGTSLPLYAEDREVEFRVDGLSCPICVFGLKKRLSEIETLKEVKVSYKKGLVRARWLGEEPFNEESIRRAVKDAGFTLREVSFPSGMEPKS